MTQDTFKIFTNIFSDLRWIWFQDNIGWLFFIINTLSMIKSDWCNVTDKEAGESDSRPWIQSCIWDDPALLLIQPSLQLRFHLMHALKGEVEVLKVADRCLAPVHSKAHLSLGTHLILVANGVSVNNFTHSVQFFTQCLILQTVCNLCCFVSGQFLLQIYELLSVKFSGLKCVSLQKHRHKRNVTSHHSFSLLWLF